MKYNKFLEDLELIDSDHKNFSIETPLRDDAFEINDDEKIKIIEKNVGEILHTLGMDMTRDKFSQKNYVFTCFLHLYVIVFDSFEFISHHV